MNEDKINEQDDAFRQNILKTERKQEFKKFFEVADPPKYIRVPISYEEENDSKLLVPLRHRDCKMPACVYDIDDVLKMNHDRKKNIVKQCATCSNVFRDPTKFFVDKHLSEIAKLVHDKYAHKNMAAIREVEIYASGQWRPVFSSYKMKINEEEAAERKLEVSMTDYQKIYKLPFFSEYREKEADKLAKEYENEYFGEDENLQIIDLFGVQIKQKDYQALKKYQNVTEKLVFFFMKYLINYQWQSLLIAKRKGEFLPRNTLMLMCITKITAFSEEKSTFKYKTLLQPMTKVKEEVLSNYSRVINLLKVDARWIVLIMNTLEATIYVYDYLQENLSNINREIITIFARKWSEGTFDFPNHIFNVHFVKVKSQEYFSDKSLYSLCQIYMVYSSPNSHLDYLIADEKFAGKFERRLCWLLLVLRKYPTFQQDGTVIMNDGDMLLESFDESRRSSASFEGNQGEGASNENYKNQRKSSQKNLSNNNTSLDNIIKRKSSDNSVPYRISIERASPQNKKSLFLNQNGSNPNSLPSSVTNLGIPDQFSRHSSSQAIQKENNQKPSELGNLLLKSPTLRKSVSKDNRKSQELLDSENKVRASGIGEIFLKSPTIRNMPKENRKNSDNPGTGSKKGSLLDFDNGKKISELLTPSIKSPALLMKSPAVGKTSIFSTQMENVPGSSKKLNSSEKEIAERKSIELPPINSRRSSLKSALKKTRTLDSFKNKLPQLKINSVVKQKIEKSEDLHLTKPEMMNLLIKHKEVAKEALSSKRGNQKRFSKQFLLKNLNESNFEKNQNKMAVPITKLEEMLQLQMNKIKNNPPPPVPYPMYNPYAQYNQNESTDSEEEQANYLERARMMLKVRERLKDPEFRSNFNGRLRNFLESKVLIEKMFGKSNKAPTSESETDDEYGGMNYFNRPPGWEMNYSNGYGYYDEDDEEDDDEEDETEEEYDRYQYMF